ncbi:alpha/beta hydrolase [Dactylosporangium cerinum]|uniref:Alpha/beta hydrolase n=1 Tax=Dactylosporangium cerinum TaxID=1434730 RepID=A0ABV9VL73_9ACTN
MRQQHDRECAATRPRPPPAPPAPPIIPDHRCHPQPRKTVGQVVEHYTTIIGKLDKKPIVIGHSFGGLLAQIIAGQGLAAATVAIDSAPFRAVLPLPISALRAASPALGTPQTGIAPSRSPSSSSTTRSPTRSTRWRQRSCMRRSSCPPPAHRSSRRQPRTSTRGPRRR